MTPKHTMSRHTDLQSPFGDGGTSRGDIAQGSRTDGGSGGGAGGEAQTTLMRTGRGVATVFSASGFGAVKFSRSGIGHRRSPYTSTSWLIAAHVSLDISRVGGSVSSTSR